MESSSNDLSFHTETFGMIHFVWPVKNHYFTKYDSVSFGVRQYTKSIQQGKYSDELSCYYDSSNSKLKYNDESITVVDSIQNIFTLLSRLSKQSVSDIDTKWFPMNHEGIPHRARFLWAGVESIEIDGANILCDHYRLDIEKIEGNSIEVYPWDYFTDHIASKEALRQLWVEQGGKRRVIKASVLIYGMSVTAELQYK